MIDYHTTICPNCNGERVVPDRVYGHQHEGLIYRQCDACNGTGSVLVPIKVDYIPMWFIIIMAAFMGICVAIAILEGFKI